MKMVMSYSSIWMYCKDSLKRQTNSHCTEKLIFDIDYFKDVGLNLPSYCINIFTKVASRAGTFLAK